MVTKKQVQKRVLAKMLPSCLERSPTTNIFEHLSTSTRDFLIRFVSFEDDEEDPLLASFWRESAWCVLTTRRLVWQNGSDLRSLAWMDLVGIQQPPATSVRIIREEIAGNAVSTLELFDSAERKYEVEVHPGEPYFLVWSAILRFCNFTRAPDPIVL